MDFWGLLNNIKNSVSNWFAPSAPLVSPQPAPITTTSNIRELPRTGGDVLGAATTQNYPAATRAAAPTPSAPADNSSQLAQQAYNNRVNAIRSLFDRTKSQAADLRSQAANTFNDLLKSVNAFRDRAKEQYGSAGQEITNRASDILGTNATNAQQLVGKATGQARGLGLGLSSRLNLGQNLLNNLQGTQGNTIAKRGEQQASNSNLYQTRLDQAQGQEDAATRYKQGVEDQARQLETTGLDQFGENQDAASNAFNQSLNGIMNYQRQLAALNPLNAGGLTQMAPDFSGITNTLNNVLPVGSVGTVTDGNVDAVNLANPTTLADLLKRRPTNPFLA